MTLAKRIRDYRYIKGWGPDELANRAQISRTALYQIESGKTELPRAATLRRIARALDVPMDILLGNTEIAAMERASAARPVRELAPPPSEREYAWGSPGTEDEPVGYMASERSRSHSGTGSRPTANRGELAKMLLDLLDSPLGPDVAHYIEQSYQQISRTSTRKSS